MIYIAHRGLTHGPNPELENHPAQIVQAVKNGYECEVDLWVKDGELYLGHDAPTYQINYTFLAVRPLWIHAKNIDALKWLRDNHKKFNYFWHENDRFTLTSEGYIWTYPGNILTENSICVMPEWHMKPEELVVFQENCYGVCSDYVGLMKKNI